MIIRIDIVVAQQQLMIAVDKVFFLFSLCNQINEFRKETFKIDALLSWYEPA